ncbi:LacI family DNA-binding transcriptional regulator [Nonomuraea angiospora]|uniref:LacI family DNA-binding transcriptional regulator n=1 Tax=Nonomuraea angiospora TaxID=46172 RepID=UPI0029A4C07E|nr:LacI family DNA-binding transcriptional regulator [Nonomuraea angiospora]MDX3099334.1 LacI family DNA-binding transcriptional regulator [Nonomuraea angiospora]
MTRRLADVAKYAGVSEATVSRVLNSRSGISDSTRDAVLATLDDSGYEQPVKLRGQRPRLVGLVLPDLLNPIFPVFADVVGGALVRKGFMPVLCTRTDGGVSEADYISMLLGQQVSGVIFAGGDYARADADHNHYRVLLHRRLPVILMNAATDGLGFSRVSADDEVAVAKAYGHLRSLGHERIGIIVGPAAHVPSQRKLQAFPGDPKLAEHAILSMEGGHFAASQMIEWGATGLICASDMLALGAIRGARRNGLNVPDDVSVVGYDDSALMTCADPPLTTIRQPIEAMGQAAVSLLAAEAADSPAAPHELLFDPELVVRRSTAPRRKSRPS